MGQASEGLALQNKKWSLPSETRPGQKNVTRPSLAVKSEIYLPPLQMKRSLIRLCAGEEDKEKEGFGYLRQKFPKIIEAKVKEGIFYGPQIKPPF
jgi:hypothetical protein